MKRVAIYARISTSDKRQDLDTQLIPLKEYVSARGWSTYEIYTDEISGSKEKRVGLDMLLDSAKKRLFDTVLVYRFDRFARSTKHLINSLEMFRALGIDFISYQENIDTSTPAGKAMFTMVSAFAEFERSIIQERVKSGIAKAKAKGVKMGRPRNINVDTYKIRELKGDGLSVRKIASLLSIPKSTVQNYC